MNGQITGLYASILALMMIYLSYCVANIRRTKKIGIGTNNDPELEKAIRVHANLIEYAPIALILLYLCELQGIPSGWLHVMGIALIIARQAHAFGLSRSSGYSIGRFYGTVTTYLLIVIMSFLNIGNYFIW